MSIEIIQSNSDKEFDYEDYNVSIIGNKPYIRLNDKVDLYIVFGLLLNMLKHKDKDIQLIQDFKHTLRKTIYEWQDILTKSIYLYRNNKVLLYCNYFKIKYGVINTSIECIWETFNDLELSIAIDLDFADKEIKEWDENGKLPAKFKLNHLEDLELIQAITIDNYFTYSYKFDPKKYINYYGMKDLSCEKSS